MSQAALREVLGRAQGFRALARAFAPPGDMARVLTDLAALAARSRGPLGAAAARAVEALAAERGAPLCDAHAALFGGHGGVPAREGAYTDARRIAPAELADLRGFLLAFKLEERGELADHVASECELASLLALKQAWALAEGEAERAQIAGEAYRALVADHLARFAPRFAARVRAAAAPAFYAAAADALEAFVAGEADRLGVPSEPDAFVPDTGACGGAAGPGSGCGGCSD
jgi:TorA maturation chaperone TorD